MLNKTHYFLSLWALSSLSDLYMMIFYGFSSSMLINYPMVQIGLYGIILLFGFYCSLHAGFRFVLLEHDHNIVRDIIKPTVIFGAELLVILFLINIVLPISLLKSPFVDFSLCSNNLTLSK